MAVLDTILLVGLILQAPAGADPPAPPPASADQRDPSLDRIRARLADPPLISPPPATPFPSRTSGRPLFQVRTDGLMPPWDWLDDGTSIPDYIRPTLPPTHHEFLLSVTPEMFRGVAVHPYGVPVLSIGRALAKATRAARRRSREAHAREEVQEALAAFEASIKKPDPPR